MREKLDERTVNEVFKESYDYLNAFMDQCINNNTGLTDEYRTQWGLAIVTFVNGYLLEVMPRLGFKATSFAVKYKTDDGVEHSEDLLESEKEEQ